MDVVNNDAFELDIAAVMKNDVIGWPQAICRLQHMQHLPERFTIVPEHFRRKIRVVGHSGQ
ncbi:hypothetical protein [Burkholderia alba]|uniref:hypothetical protein n=1 Tax=Burkholderia alba TaxID=2683677 RepID=UPI002B05680B|nr:hypothetical protein [Burkholderia alba]